MSQEYFHLSLLTCETHQVLAGLQPQVAVHLSQVHRLEHEPGVHLRGPGAPIDVPPVNMVARWL